ncbi:MAG TPA: toprim domain-containing protein [Candidatus Paceibacterota bacterium]
MKDGIEKLVEEFSHFPGVGPRQAKRFAFYLLTRDEKKLKSFTEELLKAKKSIAHCTLCQRLFIKTEKVTLCGICNDESRDKALLMVVGHDVDIESVEKSGSFKGYYFVLGGSIPILDEKPEEHVRLVGLKKAALAQTQKGLKELILALDANPEGEHTSDYVLKFLSPIVQEKNIKISVLGRGLSTGTELQYSDPETIKNALANRAQAK